jgi:hypothetical protein
MSRSESKSNSSVHSQTSRAANYIRYDLFRDVELKSSKRVQIIEEETQISNDPQLQRKIWEIQNRNLSEVNDPKNKVLATLICYKKGGFENTFREICLDAPDGMLSQNRLEEGRLDYKDEVKNDICEIEKMAVREGLERRLKMLEQKELEDLEKFSYTRKLELVTELEITDFDARFRKLSIDVRNAKEGDVEQNTLTAAKNVLINNGKELPENISLDDLKKQFQSFFGGTMQNLQKKKMSLLTSDFNAYKGRTRAYEAERGTINFLLEDEEKLDSAIREERGHSEDYLHYAMRQGYFVGAIKSQQESGLDRFYLLISSTNDACKRCSWKVEEIVETIRQTLDSDSNKDLICKALYFARKQMKDKDGNSFVSDYDDESITDHNLSNSRRQVIYTKPSGVVESNESKDGKRFFVSRNLHTEEERKKFGSSDNSK